MSEPNRCGPHSQIASNEQIRISQCPCGAYHVTFLRKGVSLQLGLADVKGLAEATGVALRVSEAEDRGKLLATGTGSTINLLPPAGARALGLPAPTALAPAQRCRAPRAPATEHR
jgi:hypothetical protein